MERCINLVKAQFEELRKKYQYLFYHVEENSQKIIGTIFFEDNGIKSKYDIEVNISQDYPNTIPSVCETKGVISKDWHHNGQYICLETPFRVWEIFRVQETLLNFVDNLVVPYLATYSYYIATNDSSKEHEHGAMGVLRDYKIRFNVQNDLLAFELLRILAEGNYRGHVFCPCGSGEKLRKCHGVCIQGIAADERFKKFDFMQDFLRIAVKLKEDGSITDLRNYSSKKVLRYIEDLKSNPCQKWGY